MASVDRKPVKSSNVVSVGYDAEARELHVEFKGGKVYAYSGVPQEIADHLFQVQSVGRYVQGYLVGAYPYRRVDG